MKFLLTVLILVTFNSYADTENFYSKDEIKTLSSSSIGSTDLRNSIHEIESKNQANISYRDARWELYTNIYLVEDQESAPYVLDVYCEHKIRNNVSQNSLPHGSGTNIEHTWPQSSFSEDYDKMMQKTDLHHLFITDAKANHLRGHQHFGEVQNFLSGKGQCKNAGLGILVQPPANVAWSSNDYYQPPSFHRGNVARALFYFATRYQLKINDTQEYFLRKWHKEDPVDEIDVIRNDRIEAIQGNRNPFIDFPELVDKIDNF